MSCFSISTKDYGASVLPRFIIYSERENSCIFTRKLLKISVIEITDVKIQIKEIKEAVRKLRRNFLNVEIELKADSTL